MTGLASIANRLPNGEDSKLNALLASSSSPPLKLVTLLWLRATLLPFLDVDCMSNFSSVSQNSGILPELFSAEALLLDPAFLFDDVGVDVVSLFLSFPLLLSDSFEDASSPFHGKKCPGNDLASEMRTSKVCLQTTVDAPGWMLMQLALSAPVALLLFLPVANLFTWNTFALNPRAASIDTLNQLGAFSLFVEAAAADKAHSEDLEEEVLLRTLAAGGMSDDEELFWISCIGFDSLDLSRIESKELTTQSLVGEW